MQGSYGYKNITFCLIWKDFAQGSNHESIIIIGEDLKQMATLIHSWIHKEQLPTKKKRLEACKTENKVPKIQEKL